MNDTPARTCPTPRVLQLCEDMAADLDRIERDHGREARAAAIDDLLARLGA